MKRLLSVALLLCLVLAAFGQNTRARTILFDDPNDPSQVTGYHISYGNTRGGPYNLGKINLAAGTTTTSISLPKGTYYFVVTAYNPDSESGYSDEASTTIFDNAQKVINLKILVQ